MCVHRKLSPGGGGALWRQICAYLHTWLTPMPQPAKGHVALAAWEETSPASSQGVPCQNLTADVSEILGNPLLPRLNVPFKI